MSCARKCALQWRRVVRERKLRARTVHTSPTVTTPTDLHRQQQPVSKPLTTEPTSDLWNNLAR